MTRIRITVIDRARQDRAYLCFLPSGLLAVAAGIAASTPMDTGTAGGVGYLVLLPLVLFVLVFAPRGIFLAIMLRRDYMFLMLSVLTVLWVVAMLAEFGPEMVRSAGSIIYGCMVYLLVATWFVRTRRQPGRT